MNDSTNDTDQTAPLTGSAGHNDFKEIAHSGGKITFNIFSDANGCKSYQITSSGSRPAPMRMAGVISARKKGRLRCHKRPKPREETPKEGSDSGWGSGSLLHTPSTMIATSGSIERG
jgi:hypothetical protein